MTSRRFVPPQTIAVMADRHWTVPVRLCWRGHWEVVAETVATWEATTGWWRETPEAAQRRYYRLLTRSGLHCIIYCDLGCGRWYLEQVID